MSWVESGGGGVTTGGDYQLGDVTADALILDQANADVGLARSAAGRLEVTDGSTGTGGLEAAYLYVMNGSTRAAAFSTAGIEVGPSDVINWNDSENVSGGSNDVGLARNAAGVLEVTDGGAGNGTLLVGDGAVGAPSYSFANDTDTGFYLSGVGQPAIVIGGSEVFEFFSSGTRVPSGLDMSFANGADQLRWPTVAIDGSATGVCKITNYTNGAGWHIATASEELTALSGASASTTNLVPAGGRILNVVVRVTTTVTGATSFDIGDGSDVDRYGATVALTAGTTTDHSDATADPMSWSAAAQDVTLTANGSSFTGGAVRVVATYLAAEPPGS